MAWHRIGDREVDRTVNVPPINGEPRQVAQNILSTELAIFADNCFCETEDGFSEEHIPKERVQFDGIPQDERQLLSRCGVRAHLDISHIGEVWICPFRQSRVCEKFIGFLAERGDFRVS